MDKEITAARKIAEEREYENAMQMKMIEKKKLQEEKAAMLRRLEQDKIERFGGKLPAQSQQKAEKTPKENIDHGIKTVNSIYTPMRAPGVAKTCFKTCTTFGNNVLKDPSNEKFRRVNLDNENVKKRVGDISGAKFILKGMGFNPNPDGTNTLIMDKVDQASIEYAIKAMSQYVD